MRYAWSLVDDKRPRKPDPELWGTKLARQQLRDEAWQVVRYREGKPRLSHGSNGGSGARESSAPRGGALRPDFRTVARKDASKPRGRWPDDTTQPPESAEKSAPSLPPSPRSCESDTIHQDPLPLRPDYELEAKLNQHEASAAVTASTDSTDAADIPAVIVSPDASPGPDLATRKNHPHPPSPSLRPDHKLDTKLTVGEKSHDGDDASGTATIATSSSKGKVFQGLKSVFGTLAKPFRWRGRAQFSSTIKKPQQQQEQLSTWKLAGLMMENGSNLHLGPPEVVERALGKGIGGNEDGQEEKKENKNTKTMGISFGKASSQSSESPLLTHSSDGLVSLSSSDQLECDRKSYRSHSPTRPNAKWPTVAAATKITPPHTPSLSPVPGTLRGILKKPAAAGKETLGRNRNPGPYDGTAPLSPTPASLGIAGSPPLFLGQRKFKTPVSLATKQKRQTMVKERGGEREGLKEERACPGTGSLIAKTVPRRSVSMADIRGRGRTKSLKRPYVESHVISGNMASCGGLRAEREGGQGEQRGGRGGGSLRRRERLGRVGGRLRGSGSLIDLVPRKRVRFGD